MTDAARLAQLKGERLQLVRVLATERDNRKKAHSAVLQLQAQLAAATVELDRLRGKLAIAADAPHRLQATREENALLQSVIENKSAELVYIKSQYKHVESQLLELEGGMVHRSVAVKRGVEAVQAAQRMKSEKKLLQQLQKQEATLNQSIQDARTKLDLLRGGGGSTVDSPSRSSAISAPDGDHMESLAQVQLEYERRKRVAVAETQDELNRLDRELDRRKAEAEMREAEKRAALGTKVARAETDRSSSLREQANLKSQQQAAAMRGEELRKRIAHLDKEYSSASEQNERLDLDLVRLTRRLSEINASLDAELRKGALASTHAAQAADSWKSEKQHLESTAAGIEKRIRELRHEIKRSQEAAAKMNNPSEAMANADEHSDKTKAIAAAKANAKAIREEADRITADATQQEGRNATSQKDSIIEKLKSQIDAMEAATAATTRENADLSKKLASVQEALKRNNLSA